MRLSTIRSGSLSNVLDGSWTPVLILAHFNQLKYKRYFVSLQVDMPCFVDNHGRSAPFQTEVEEEQFEGKQMGVGVGTGGGRGNCSQNVKQMH